MDLRTVKEEFVEMDFPTVKEEIVEGPTEGDPMGMDAGATERQV